MCYCSSFLSLIQNRRKCWRLNPQSILTEIMLRIGSIERFESNRFISKNVSFPLVIRRSEIDVTRYISLLVRTNAWSICAIYQRLSCHIMIHSQRPTMPILMITYRQILTTHQLRPTGGFFFFWRTSMDDRWLLFKETSAIPWYMRSSESPVNEQCSLSELI